MLKQRILTALIALAVLLIVIFVLPPNAAKAFIGLLVLGGAWEWAGFLEADNPLVRVVYVAFIAACLFAVDLVLPGATMTILMASLGWWALALAWTFVFPTPIPMLFRWFGGALVLVPLFVALASLYATGPAYLLFALFVVWAADVGAYFAGRRFGRVKLAPSISPGKTWEGVIGGLVAVAVVASVFAALLGLEPGLIVPFSMAAAALSVVGDLTVSMFKRTAGLKDSGKLFPGHGGILDRIDSVSAAAPLIAIGLTVAGVAA
jgi:phosphatidate cytidylyltransferase